MALGAPVRLLRPPRRRGACAPPCEAWASPARRPQRPAPTSGSPRRRNPTSQSVRCGQWGGRAPSATLGASNCTCGTVSRGRGRPREGCAPPAREKSLFSAFPETRKPRLDGLLLFAAWLPRAQLPARLRCAPHPSNPRPEAPTSPPPRTPPRRAHACGQWDGRARRMALAVHAAASPRCAHSGVAAMGSCLLFFGMSSPPPMSVPTVGPQQVACRAAPGDRCSRDHRHRPG